MGLDLILYSAFKDKEEMSIREEQDAELAYGRKTWAIADFFRARCESIFDDYEYRVTRADWNEFMDGLEALNDEMFRMDVEAFCEAENASREDYDRFEAWLDTALENDTTYYLGLDWELAAVLRWFDANEDVQDAFDNGEDVRLIVSY